MRPQGEKSFSSNQKSNESENPFFFSGRKKDGAKECPVPRETYTLGMKQPDYRPTTYYFPFDVCNKKKSLYLVNSSSSGGLNGQMGF